jgi:hypothetical protein
LVGTSFEWSRLLTGEIALGYTNRVYQDPRLADISALVGDASLTWTASALTTVKLTGASTVGESTVPGVSGVLYRDVGLQVDHAFRQCLIGSVKVGFGFDDYVGLSREDKRYSAGAGLTYKLNRSWQIKGEVSARLAALEYHRRRLHGDKLPRRPALAALNPTNDN